MPYYHDQAALSPLPETLISRARLERVLSVGGTGFRSVVDNLFYRARLTPVENYKGFFIPGSMTFGRVREEHIHYTLALLDDAVDVRITDTSKTTSPWIDESHSPDLSEIDAHWAAVNSETTLAKVVEIFTSLEDYVIDEAAETAPPVSKLSRIKPTQISVKPLEKFCNLLGGNNADIMKFTREHIIPAAEDPRRYVQDTGKLATMSATDCDYFSWYSLIRDVDSLFKSRNLLIDEDWKGMAVDVEWSIEALLKARDLHVKKPITLTDIPDDYLTSTYLDQAYTQLHKQGLWLVYIDEGGDSYTFTVLKKSEAKKLIKWGQALGLKVSSSLNA